MKIIRPIAISDTGAFSRASVGSYFDKTGALQSAAVDVARFTYDPADLSKPPIFLLEAASTNLVLNSATLGTQSVTVTNVTHTLSFYGTGSVTLSGTYSGVSTGTGANTRTSLSFTPTAGTLTLTVAGSCTMGQLETGRVTSYIPTTGSTVGRSAEVNTLGMLSLLPENDYADYDPAKIYILTDRVKVVSTSVHKIYESATGSSSTVTISNASPGVVTWAAHGLAANTPVSFSTTGGLPTGLVAGTVYYVSSVAIALNTFHVTSTIGGADINTSSAGSGTHTGRGSINHNKTPSSNPDVWLDAGSTNKWAMFDQSVQSQTLATDVINVAIPVPTTQLVDSVVIQNAAGKSVRVAMMDTTDGVVYDQTGTLISDSGIQDWHAWFFEPIVRKTDILFSNLPPYAGATLSVSVAATGESVACGICVAGLSKTVGPTQAGMGVGIADYSSKTTDTFGNTTITERPYAKTMDLTCWVDNSNFDAVLGLLNSYRAIPIVYIGSDTLTASMQYGYYKDYNAGVQYETVSILHLQIESLT